MNNETHAGAKDLPGVLPLFPLTGGLLLPRGQLPLNIFEPRYLTMIDDALKGHRMIGMIQPDPQTQASQTSPASPSRSTPPRGPAAKEAGGLFKVGCAGRISQFAESGDGRYLITLTGVSRFGLVDEIATVTPYRQAKVDFTAFVSDLSPRFGENEVDRESVLRALRDFAASNGLQIDWDSINDAPNEALVNALAMMCPFGPREKQALLEAADLKGRADVLVAITEIELARSQNAPASLQ